MDNKCVRCNELPSQLVLGTFHFSHNSASTQAEIVQSRVAVRISTTNPKVRFLFVELQAQRLERVAKGGGPKSRARCGWIQLLRWMSATCRPPNVFRCSFADALILGRLANGLREGQSYSCDYAQC